jgi:hypothetical protein
MSLLKDAEKNVLKTAKELELAQKYMTALAHFGNTVFRYEEERDEFFKGLKICRNAVYSRYCNAILDCFMFSSIGGEEMKEYQKEIFATQFKEDDIKYSVMQFLEEWGNLPRGWKKSDEEKFRKEAAEFIEKNS